MNLVSTIMSLLGPAIINRMASSLGLGQGLAGKAVAAAIPAILAGLTSSASRSGGAGALGNILSRQDPGILGNLGNLIGGSGQQQLVEGGTSALSSLLGGSGLSALTGAIGKFSGANPSQSSSLLGMLAPVVLGQLAQTQRASGLDANGVANLLASQKSNISAAMPAGFSDLLQGSGLLDSVAQAQAPRVAPVEQPSGGGLGKWLLPLAIALAALFLLNTYGCNRTATVAPPKVEAPKVEAPAVPAAPKVEAPAAVSPADVLKAMTGLTGTIGAIKDEASAKASIPALNDAAKQIDAIKTAAGLLPAEARKPIATAVSSALPSLSAAIEKAVGIPGVGALISPILQPVVNNLGALAKL